MAANEERVFDDIDNLLEAEGILSQGTHKPTVDWKTRMKGSSFKKNLRKDPPAHSSYEEDSPFDESLPFDESFSGIGQGHKSDPIAKEDVEADLFDASMNLPVMEEENEPDALEDEAANTHSHLFWYRNTVETASRGPTEVMNEILIAGGMNSSTNPTALERSMEMAATDVYDELLDIIAQTTPTKSVQEVHEEPTQDQQFVMDILSGPADSPPRSPTKEFLKQETPVQSRSVRASPFADESNPYCSDEMEELDQALNAMTLAQTQSDFVAKEATTSPNEKDLISIDPIPITPPPPDHVIMMDPAYGNYSESEDEEDGIVRIQLTDEDVYGRDFEAKALAEHPVLMHEHNFTLHRSIQARAVDTFCDEPSSSAVSIEASMEARVMNILSPIRDMLTPKKWKGSPTTPATVGESPTHGDIESGSVNARLRSNLSNRFRLATFRDEPNSSSPPAEESMEARVMNILSPIRDMLTPKRWKRSPETPATVGESPTHGDVEGRFGDAILRSNRFRFAMDTEGDEEYVHWKDRYCTKRQIYLMAILAVLVIAFIAVVSAMIGMQNDEVAEQEGINDFYRVTGDGSHGSN
ncbi:unnamed protein product [Cylindrotheca closterium]|uniref:Uncharacterized protein n=1 Tax=Cylindrotheca closterium TaxID=2856 RepID=A0AAD2FWK1_9STRA|nr:unnamed protein product [Cylindrotheca closterium]